MNSQTFVIGLAIALTWILGASMPVTASERAPLSSVNSPSGKSGDFEANLHIVQEFDTSTPTSRPGFTLGEKVEIRINFCNPALDDENMSGVLMDCLVRRPDGSIFSEDRNCPGWTLKKPAPRDEMLDAECYFSFQTDERSPVGTYSVTITIKDIPGQRAIKLETPIEIAAERPGT